MFLSLTIILKINVYTQTHSYIYRWDLICMNEGWLFMQVMLKKS